MSKKLLVSVLVVLICTGAFLIYLLIHESNSDTQPPVISFSDGVLELSTKASEADYLRGVAAEDNVDGDVTASVVVDSVQFSGENGAIRITYAAFDAAGNVTKAVRQARYTDYESPRFVLNQSLTFSVNSLYDIFDFVKAEDCLDGDISHRVRITCLGEKNLLEEGIHMVSVSVRNSLGETVTLELPVEVYEAGLYDATLKLTDYLIYLPVGTELNAESFLDSYNRLGVSFSLQNALPKGYSLDIKNYVLPHVPGVYTVEYRVAQETEDGGKVHTGYAKLIVVLEG